MQSSSYVQLYNVDTIVLRFIKNVLTCHVLFILDANVSYQYIKRLALFMNDDLPYFNPAKMYCPRRSWY